MTSTTSHPLQTMAWAEFRKKWGNEVVNINSFILTVHKIPFFGFKFAVFERGESPNKEMLTQLIDFSKKENLFYIKLEPNVKKDQKIINLLRNNGAVPGKTIFTKTTFWIDLTKSEEDLLKSFTSKTRYNIRLAQKKGVVVEEDNSDSSFESYLKLTRETVQRDKFYAHSEKYHRLMWQTLKPKGIARLLIARYNKEAIAAWILFNNKDFLYYPYGASTHKYKNLMASNLMMWEAIKLGKKLNLKTFDLWGREEGKGFTRFKEGYNPEVVEFIGTWDLIINKPIYYFYRLMDLIRWFILRTKSKFINPAF